MSKVNFTAKRVLELECEPGKSQSIHRDAAQPGLGLRVTAAGERAYIHEQKLNSRTIRVTIGSPAAWALEKARSESARLRVLIDSGRDPRAERRQQDADDTARLDEAKRATVTLADAWAAYIAARKSQWSARYLRDHIALAQEGGEAYRRGKGVTEAGPIAKLLPLKLLELTPATIGKWLATEATENERPEVARMAFLRLKICAAWCETQPAYSGLIHAQAFAADLLKSNLPKAKPKTDCLQREQLEPWFAAARKQEPTIAAYLQAALLTGARREELAGLRWEHVDFQWRSITIVKGKTGERVIPLTPYLASLLVELKRRNEQGPNTRQIREKFDGKPEAWQPSEFVFSSRSASGRLTSPTRALNRVCQLAAVPHVTIHGLRRSFGTLSEWVDLPVGVAAQIMGHAPSAVAEKHYRVRPLDLLRQHADKFESWILSEAKIEFTPAAAQAAPMLKVAS